MLYEQLELPRRTRQSPRPLKIDIDEQLFGARFQAQSAMLRQDDRRPQEQALTEVVEGNEGAVLRAALAHIPGRENVRWVALDFSDSYRAFARDYFPNAQLLSACAERQSLLAHPQVRRARRVPADLLTAPTGHAR